MITKLRAFSLLLWATEGEGSYYQQQHGATLVFGNWETPTQSSHGVPPDCTESQLNTAASSHLSRVHIAYNVDSKERLTPDRE